MTALITTIALYLVPLGYALGAVNTQWQKEAQHHRVWAHTNGMAVIALLSAVVGASLLLFYPALDVNGWLKADVLSVIMAVLIAFIGFVILRFSHHYMDGDTKQNYFQRWFLWTLTAISVLVLSNHIVISWLAWVASSLSLHKLLIYYPERPKALLAAHKKFILSRFADVALLASFILLYVDAQSFKIDEILATYVSRETLSLTAEIAMIMMTFAAILKCAQLPFHGWLLQVMEAPTPVSALLHAGIVNIGGFLIMRFADVFLLASASQWLLLIVGTLTALIASLIMMTRISIKVMLAWSTCAQMGFMLMEIALGLYELALLHLVAHSCYKAFNFLNAGETVNTQIAYELRSPRRGYRAILWLLAPIAVSGASYLAIDLWFDASLQLLLIAAIVSFAISVYLAEAQRFISTSTFVPMLLMALITIGVYALWHSLFALGTDSLFPTHNNGNVETLFVMIAFLIFYGLFASLRLWPDSVLSQRLYPPLYAGLYLDEWFTRQTLKWWPITFTDSDTSTLTSNHKECC